MKRILTVIGLGACFYCQGLYVGNPYLPELPEEGLFFSETAPLGIKTSYVGSFIFNRPLKVYKQEKNSKNEKFSLLTNEGFLTLNFINRVEIYSGFGTGVFKWEEILNQSSFIKMLSKQSFIWDIGGRVLLIFWEKTCLGFFAGYQSSHPPLKEITQNGQVVQTKDQKLSYSDWEIAITIGQKAGVFSPYLGGSYSKTLLKVKVPNQREMISKKYENQHSFCLIAGANISATKAFGIDIEAKAFGETSVSFNANFRF